jgi:alkylation response protein AidB-like acyl-CoA dehydrogenase
LAVDRRTRQAGPSPGTPLRHDGDDARVRKVLIMVDTVAPATDITEAVRAWLEDNWSLDLTVAEWWERLGLAGWALPTLPPEWYGKGASREEGIRVAQTIAQAGVLGAPGGLGLLLAGPTINVHGTEEQKERYLRDIVTGRKAWCQLFSEPGAGSDLAGLTTTAVKDGDEWVVNGQKVWTSTAQVADLGMLLARTNPDVPKHQGITYFAFNMDQPGVEVRPLREMTGRALFNEVFLTDVRVRDDDAVGGINNGWAVANTTLAFERAGLGAGAAGGGAFGATPGTKAGALDRKVSDFVATRRGANGAPRSGIGVNTDFLIEMAKQRGKIGDATIRQDLMQLYTLNEIARFTNLRARALRKVGQEIPGLGNMAKLSMSRILRLSRDTSYRIVGPAGMLHAYNEADRTALDRATGFPELGSITEAALFAQGPSIYGGTDEIQHNILGERVLGLPREPNPDRDRPFRELPRNG